MTSTSQKRIVKTIQTYNIDNMLIINKVTQTGAWKCKTKYYRIASM